MPPSSLIWEDADISNAQSWWLARSRSEATDDARDFVSAEDPICNYLVGMVRSGSGGTYLVIAAAPLSEAVHLGDVVLTIKDQITGWLVTPLDSATRGYVRRWRRGRDWVLVRRNFPLAIAALLVGGFLGFLVTMFAVTWGLVGWSMLGAGLVLKYIADRKKSEALLGPWERFVVITIAAVVGVIAASISVLTLFWN